MLRVVREADCFNSHSGIRLALSVVLFQNLLREESFRCKKNFKYWPTRLLLDLMCIRLWITHHLDRDANPIRGNEHILPVFMLFSITSREVL
jgi:hypothetical protein